MNVDNLEINKFSRLAANWWDPNGDFKTLHEINPLRLSYIQQFVPSLQGKKVLDIGCGGGILSEGMAKMGAQVTAIDMAEASLEVAKLHLLESKLDINYLKITAEEFADQELENFDVVVCMEMLEHVPEPKSVVQACQKLTKPGGKIFFSTINRNLKSWLFAIVGAEYVLNLLPKGTHDHDKFIKPSELASWLRQCNLNSLDITGLQYNPVTKIYSLGQDVAVNYLHAAYK